MFLSTRPYTLPSSRGWVGRRGIARKKTLTFCWAGAAMPKPLAIQKCDVTDRPTHQQRLLESRSRDSKNRLDLYYIGWTVITHHFTILFSVVHVLNGLVELWSVKMTTWEGNHIWRTVIRKVNKYVIVGTRLYHLISTKIKSEDETFKIFSVVWAVTALIGGR